MLNSGLISTKAHALMLSPLSEMQSRRNFNRPSSQLPPPSASSFTTALSGYNYKISSNFVTFYLGQIINFRPFFFLLFQGCDASILLASASNQAEKDHPDNLSLAGDGFDTVIKAKAAVDSNPKCRNKVSCADILAIAARDVVNLVHTYLIYCIKKFNILGLKLNSPFVYICLQKGGPFYKVELGRRDGRVSAISSVQHHIPSPDFNLNQLTSLFAANGLNITDLVALSGTNINCLLLHSLLHVDTCKRKGKCEDGLITIIYFLSSQSQLIFPGAHTIGFSHCSRFSKRIYGPKSDPTLNREYASELRKQCPLRPVNPAVVALLDPTSPDAFDNVYFKNLQGGKGLLSSDQLLFTDKRSKATVNLFASNNKIFNSAFAEAMIKLGRVGVLTGKRGEIRIDCTNPN